MDGSAADDASAASPFVLLDVDGVLHPLKASGHPLHASMDELTRRCDDELNNEDDERVGETVRGEFLPENMQALAWIVRETNARIVLSSTWRETAPQRRAVDAQLALHGIPPAIGATPRLPILSGGRAAEILAWVDAAEFASAGTCYWIALDDLPLEGLPPDCFVKVDPVHGLTIGDAERVCECLRAQRRRADAALAEADHRRRLQVTSAGLAALGVEAPQ